MQQLYSKRVFFILMLIFFIFNSTIPFDRPFYFVTAANSPYFGRLLNLIGSIHQTQFDKVGEIAVFNLGLSRHEIDHLNKIDKVNVYEVERVVPNLLHRLGNFAWKPVAIKQALEMFPYVLWLDAGTTVLKPLDALFEYIAEEKGYFISTIGDETTPDGKRFLHTVEWGMTRYVRNKFNMDSPELRWIFPMESIMGGIIGVARWGKDQFLMPLYEMVKDLRNYDDEGTSISEREGRGSRHDQVLISILGYSKHLEVFQQNHQQDKETFLIVKNQKKPFYVTWNMKYVCNKTHIWSSRGDTGNYRNSIHYK